MCVIIEAPVGETLDPQKLENASWVNQDGLGWMYIDPATNEMVVGREYFERTYEQSERLQKLMLEHKNIHVVYHLRYGTHGTNDLSNVHPFQVLNKTEHGIDLWFMHNGIISIASNAVEDKDLSDTQIFNKYILQPILSVNPDLLYTHAFQELIGDYTKGSRLLFMDSNGVIVKTGSWDTNENCAVSNNSYFSGSSRRVTGNYAASGSGYAVIGYVKGDEDRYSATEGGFDWKKWEEDLEKKQYTDPSNAVLGTSSSTAKACTIERDNTDDYYGMVSVNGRLMYADQVKCEDVSLMSDEELEDLCDTYPDVAAMLLQDMSFWYDYAQYNHDNKQKVN